MRPLWLVDERGSSWVILLGTDLGDTWAAQDAPSCVELRVAAVRDIARARTSRDVSRAARRSSNPNLEPARLERLGRDVAFRECQRDCRRAFAAGAEDEHDPRADARFRNL